MTNNTQSLYTAGGTRNYNIWSNWFLPQNVCS